MMLDLIVLHLDTGQLPDSVIRNVLLKFCVSIKHPSSMLLCPFMSLLMKYMHILFDFLHYIHTRCEVVEVVIHYSS